MSDVLSGISRDYLRLVLALGNHDKDYVDAYYGAAELRSGVQRLDLGTREIGVRADALLAQLQASPADGDELDCLRYQYLEKQISSLCARVRMLQGQRFSFDEESRALYDTAAPTNPESHFQQVLDELEHRFTGKGALSDRYDRWRQAFVIPTSRVHDVFTAAVEEGRARTKAHVPLPPDEHFVVEYVTGKSWSGYNWYQGGFRSLIQVNTDLPIYIDRAVDLGCHEGYPGHHVYNVLLEQHLIRGRGWNEFSVYALFSPQSVIAEGTANFGIEVAFPGAERLAFEQERLFPLAGLDRRRAAEYYEVQTLVERLSYAGNEAARRYLDGHIDSAGAAQWLERYALMAPARARQRVRFFDQCRSYVINYNVGKDLVRQFIESRGGNGDRPDVRWREFAALLSSPRLPSGLR
jgi:hypothetical protein